MLNKENSAAKIKFIFNKTLLLVTKLSVKKEERNNVLQKSFLNVKNTICKLVATGLCCGVSFIKFLWIVSFISRNSYA